MLPTRRLGKTSLEVSIIGLGGLHLIDIEDPSTDKIIHRALDLGINFLETSHHYGDGKAEKKFGRVLRRRRSECIFYGRCFGSSEEPMAEALDRTLSNLQTDMIDIYGIHDVTRDDAVAGFQGQLETLKKAQSAGKIRYLAVSGHRETELVRTIKTRYFDVVMVAVNPLDLDIARAVIPVAKKLGMGIIAMKPFAGGLFTEDPSRSLRYVLGQDISAASIGMKSVNEVEENVSIAKAFRPLSRRESERLLGQLDRLTKKLGKNICRQCGYCIREPCPQSIDIPRILYMERIRERYYGPGWAKSEYMRLEPKVDACEDCHQCEEACPYELPVVKMLESAHSKLSEE